MNHSTPATADQLASPTHLIGAYTPLQQWMNSCPLARTISAHSETLGEWVLIALGCNNWGCPVCGRRKVSKYAMMVAAAKPNRLVTLTVDPKLYTDPRGAYDRTRRTIPKLLNQLRKKYGEVECFRVLEVTKKGWPHYHLVMRSAYIPQADLQSRWQSLTGAIIVDVRAIKKSKDVYFYVVKYLAKQDHVPWTNRRVTWTRGFFPATDFTPGPGLNLRNEEFVGHTPPQAALYEYPGCTLQRYSRDCWIVVGIGRAPADLDPALNDRATRVNPKIVDDSF